MEEKVKRMGRAVNMKESIIKDLKARLEEDTIQATAAGDSETATLTANELRQRLRVADLERSRGRSRITAMRDKLAELEAEAETLREDNERLKRNSDRSESARTTLARKETLLKSQKSVIDKLSSELTDLKTETEDKLAEGERRIRNLARQLSDAEQRRIEAEREGELMRRRATNSSIRLGEYPTLLPGGPGQAPVSSYVFDGEHTSTYPPQQQAASRPPAPPAQPSATLPSSLGLSASDLHDVILAVGGGPSRVPTRHTGESLLGNSSLNESSSSSTSSSFSKPSESDLSIERRLKNLARAALQSPGQPKR
jgi:hypothetical protein